MLDRTTMTGATFGTGRWNTYVTVSVQLHCPTAGRPVDSNADTCPHCHGSLSDLAHWKWHSPDEPHPREAFYGRR